MKTFIMYLAALAVLVAMAQGQDQGQGGGRGMLSTRDPQMGGDNATKPTDPPEPQGKLADCQAVAAFHSNVMAFKNDSQDCQLSKRRMARIAAYFIFKLSHSSICKRILGEKQNGTDNSFAAVIARLDDDSTWEKGDDKDDMDDDKDKMGDGDGKMGDGKGKMGDGERNKGDGKGEMEGMDDDDGKMGGMGDAMDEVRYIIRRLCMSEMKRKDDDDDDDDKGGKNDQEIKCGKQGPKKKGGNKGKKRGPKKNQGKKNQRKNKGKKGPKKNKGKKGPKKNKGKRGGQRG